MLYYGVALGEESQETKKIEDLIADTNAAILSNKRLIIAVNNSIKELQKGIKDAETYRDELKDKIEEYKDTYHKFRKEEANRNEKILRTEKHIKIMSKKIDPIDIGRYQVSSMFLWSYAAINIDS